MDTASQGRGGCQSWPQMATHKRDGEQDLERQPRLSPRQPIRCQAGSTLRRPYDEADTTEPVRPRAQAAVCARYRFARYRPLEPRRSRLASRPVHPIAGRLLLAGTRSELTIEARTGFEPAYNGFANRCLTTWLPRRGRLRADAASCDRRDGAVLTPSRRPRKARKSFRAARRRRILARGVGQDRIVQRFLGKGPEERGPSRLGRQRRCRAAAP